MRKIVSAAMMAGISVLAATTAQADLPAGRAYIEGSISNTAYTWNAFQDSYGLQVLGGYRMPLQKNLHFSPEVFLADLGKAETRSDNENATIKTTEFGLGGKLSAQVNSQLDLFARIDYVSFKVKGHNVNFGNNNKDSEDDRSFMFGFGAEYFVDQRYSVTASYERIDLQDGGSDVETMRLGLAYAF